MSLASEDVKARVFERIGGSDAVPGLAAAGRFDDIIREVSRACAADIEAGPGPAGIVATSLLHYLLTAAAIPSKRRAEFRGRELDVVIPDTRTLGRDPARALVICVPGTSDPAGIRRALGAADAVQPMPENVWLVLSGPADTGRRTFVIAGDGGTFAGMIGEIAEFCPQSGPGRLRILGPGACEPVKDAAGGKVAGHVDHRPDHVKQPVD